MDFFTNMQGFLGNLPNNTGCFLLETDKIRIKTVPNGAALFRVEIPDKTGRFSNIALPLPSPDACIRSGTHAGTTLGPVAGRVENGRLQIPDRTLQLAQNEGRNHLHGGPGGLSRQVWQTVHARPDQVAYRLDLPDRLDGYPGNRTFWVGYALTGPAQLTIRYRVETDAPTPVSLSNHTYWNLSGDFAHPCTGHRLQIAARQACWNDQEHLPRGVLDVAGTPLDFTRSQEPAPHADHPQLHNALGYNHAYLLEGSPAVRLEHPASGRVLTMETDLPALVFYSGGYLAGEPLEGGCAAESAAFALEPQERPGLPALVLPGQPWERWIRLTFSAEQMPRQRFFT